MKQRTLPSTPEQIQQMEWLRQYVPPRELFDQAREEGYQFGFKKGQESRDKEIERMMSPRAWVGAGLLFLLFVTGFIMLWVELFGK